MQRKNWPKCRPFLRHAIKEDVPEARRGLVWRGYIAWIFMAAGFCMDWLAITIMSGSLPSLNRLSPVILSRTNSTSDMLCDASATLSSSDNFWVVTYMSYSPGAPDLGLRGSSLAQRGICRLCICMPVKWKGDTDGLVCTCRFIGGHKGLSDWLFCTLISGFGLPLSFMFWHRCLYFAAITDGGFRCYSISSCC